MSSLLEHPDNSGNTIKNNLSTKGILCYTNLYHTDIPQQGNNWRAIEEGHNIYEASINMLILADMQSSKRYIYSCYEGNVIIIWLNNITPHGNRQFGQETKGYSLSFSGKSHNNSMSNGTPILVDSITTDSSSSIKKRHNM